MKKVLILAYDYPPYISVAGLRPSYWAENFHRFGIYPTIITRAWNVKHGNELDYLEGSESDDIIIDQNEYRTIIRTPYFPTLSNRLNLKGRNGKVATVIKKVNTAFFEFFQFYSYVGTKSQLFLAADNYLKSNKVDCIIATGDPYILFKYANDLSTKYNITWIADYRDPWSTTNFINNKIRKRYARFLEKKIVNSAQLLTTVNPNIKMLLQELFPQKEIEIIANGYDESKFDRLAMIQQNSDVLTISLAGTFYEWNPYESFLVTLNQYLIDHPNKKVNLQFFGINRVAEIQNVLNRCELLRDQTTIYPRMDNGSLLEKLSQTNILLLFNYFSHGGTKIFEYVALNRQILFCYSDDREADELRNNYYQADYLNGIEENLQEKIIRETQSGIIVKDAKQLYATLDELFNEFERTKQIACNATNANTYSRYIQTKKLSDLILNSKI